MKVLITGANGFIAKNLRLHLAQRSDVDVVCFDRRHSATTLQAALSGVDFVFHLAGVNRPTEINEFVTGNTDLTVSLCNALRETARAEGRRIPVVYTSSIQAERDNAYGTSKRNAELALEAAARECGIPVFIYRLPNVFGKWCKPNYNSVVATYCYNIARDLPIRVDDASAALTLVYIDDVVHSFIQAMDGVAPALDATGFAIVRPQYSSTVGEIAGLIQRFKDSRQSLLTERVGTGFVRALYSTYLSYVPTDRFCYRVPRHADARGVFVEMLKTPDAGQFSYFTAAPGVTRGGHYHHSKSEKFLVLQGEARFRFRNMDSGETVEIGTSGEMAEVVETVPGWTHDITNVGKQELIVMLWANEVFDRAAPDTYSSAV